MGWEARSGYMSAADDPRLWIRADGIPPRGDVQDAAGGALVEGCGLSPNRERWGELELPYVQVLPRTSRGCEKV